ncbi:HD domain-containing phosphohydrolase [Marinobacter fonticola]|uniref:HD domain-containing phosphohydrolase n=1 Tax=Marinobacter fonticola TaxID=2603215 RepID=UPI0011E81680|nr:HD domain-containing phosphohydrolase [Marinobacter fonticola]
MVENTAPTPPPVFRILFVDDEASILSSLRRMMRKHDYSCFFAQSAREGLTILEENPIDLIVSDMRMPEMDGAAFLSEVKRRWPFSVRFLMTGYADMQSTVDALNLGGINRYISKPWDDAALLDAIDEGLRIRRLEREKKRLIDKTREQNRSLQQLNEELESRVEARTGEVRKQSAKLRKAFQQLKQSYDSFVRVFSSVISSRPQLIKGQSRQVADLAKNMALKLDLENSQVSYIYYAALLHELGKLNLPDDLLLRSEVNLTYRDWDTYRKYPELGEVFLTSISALAYAGTLIRQHAESYDGSGYPDGLKGAAIEPGARLIRVARDFVGLQSGMLSYDPLSPDEAFNYINERAGREYDPEMIELLRPLTHSLTIDRVSSYEVKQAIVDLVPGMTLTRDLVSQNGILLMAEGNQLTEAVIEKLTRMERVEGKKLSVYVTQTDHEEH